MTVSSIDQFRCFTEDNNYFADKMCDESKVGKNGQVKKLSKVSTKISFHEARNFSRVIKNFYDV